MFAAKIDPWGILMVFIDSLGGGHCESEVFACYQILTCMHHTLQQLLQIRLYLSLVFLL